MKSFSYVFEFANDTPNFTPVDLLLKFKIALKKVGDYIRYVP